MRLLLLVTSCFYEYRENQVYIAKTTALQLFFVISVILVGERTVLLNQVAVFSFMEISLCRAARSPKHQQRIHSLPCWCLVVPSVGYYQYAESEQYLTKMTYDVSLSSV